MCCKTWALTALVDTYITLFKTIFILCDKVTCCVLVHIQSNFRSQMLLYSSTPTLPCHKHQFHSATATRPSYPVRIMRQVRRAEAAYLVQTTWAESNVLLACTR